MAGDSGSFMPRKGDYSEATKRLKGSPTAFDIARIALGNYFDALPTRWGHARSDQGMLFIGIKKSSA